MYAVKAKGFTSLKMRHARNSSRAHWCKVRQLGSQPNTDVCHGCHRKLTPGVLYRCEGWLLCFACVGRYVKYLTGKGCSVGEVTKAAVT